MKKSTSLLVLSLITATSFADTINISVADSIAIQDAAKTLAEAALKKAVASLPPTASPFADMLIPSIILLVGGIIGWAMLRLKIKTANKKTDVKK